MTETETQMCEIKEVGLLFKEELKKALLPLYDDLLTVINKDRDFVFCMQWGKKFPSAKNEGILFVGRAPYGWIDWSNLDYDEQGIFDCLFALEDQMKWVEDKKYFTPFWRVIKDITTSIYPKNEWYEYIAWSNLYKLAPNKSNPDNPSKKEQLDYCQKILQKEIEILSPKYVVFLTGMDWAEDFLCYLNDNKEPEMSEIQWCDDYSIKITQIGKVSCIVTEHPQGKPEENHKGVIIEVITGKYKPIIDILKEKFDNLIVRYKPNVVQLYFEPYEYWVELWLGEKITLSICSDDTKENFVLAGEKYMYDCHENGYYYYYAEECEFNYPVDTKLVAKVQSILEELSNYSDK